MDRETRLRRIWETIQEIPRGCVANYGQIAEIAGVPRGARQVARLLARRRSVGTRARRTLDAPL